MGTSQTGSRGGIEGEVSGREISCVWSPNWRRGGGKGSDPKPRTGELLVGHTGNLLGVPGSCCRVWGSCWGYWGAAGVLESCWGCGKMLEGAGAGVLDAATPAYSLTSAEASCRHTP